MKPAKQRIARLMRIERIRSIAKQTSLSELAEAERHLSQVHILSQRVGRLSIVYAARTDATDGYTLVQQNRFAHAMGHVTQELSASVTTARDVADQKLLALEACERRRAAVEDVRIKAEASVRMEAFPDHVGAKAKNGTVLEKKC